MDEDEPAAAAAEATDEPTAPAAADGSFPEKEGAEGRQQKEGTPLELEDRAMAGVVAVIAHELLSARSSEALRTLANDCLQVGLCWP